jgi:DNA-binding MarR family transcriptional regulator
MNGADTQADLYWQLMQLAVRTRHDLARIAEKEYGLTGPQMHTLCLIQPDAPAAMNTLSCQMACDASNITGIADRLSAHGYIERRDDPSDRRVKVMVLTPKGTAMRQKILSELMGFMPGSADNLTAAETTMLQELLAKVLLPPRS